MLQTQFFVTIYYEFSNMIEIERAIKLVKRWGLVNETLFLDYNSSIFSMTWILKSDDAANISF